MANGICIVTNALYCRADLYAMNGIKTKKSKFLEIVIISWALMFSKNF